MFLSIHYISYFFTFTKEENKTEAYDENPDPIKEDIKKSKLNSNSFILKLIDPKLISGKIKYKNREVQKPVHW
jgi:hypothetical protein